MLTFVTAQIFIPTSRALNFSETLHYEQIHAKKAPLRARIIKLIKYYVK
jgi:hypothetical protein